ncbi:TolC family protein [Sphingobacterium sp.]|uniref:TolC family protein n=1 Tax=Sphingobacterium sp. TaxID=341027 RepID=UPI00289B6986|nr:TolC family protein [Sphingobacterium sp.]
MFKKLVLIGHVFFSCGLFCHGQENHVPIKLNDLLSSVAQHAPSLRTDYIRTQVQQARATEVKNNRLPSLQLSYQADVGSNNNVPGPYFGFGLVPTNNGGIRADNNYRAVSANLGIAALQWEFYNFGAYHAQDQLARSEVMVENRRFEQSKYDLQSFTIYSYLQLLKLHDLIGIQSRSISRNQEIRQSIFALVKSGIRAGVDTSMADAEISRSQLSLIELENQQQQLQIQLSTLAGIPSAQIVADTTAEKILFEQVKNSPIELDGSRQHPMVAYYNALFDKTKKEEKLIASSYRPKVFLSGAVWGRAASVHSDNHYGSIGEGFGLQRGNYLVGLGINYNLFDLQRKKVKLNTQRLMVDEAGQKLQEQQANIAMNVAQSAAEVKTAERRLKEIPRQTTAANAAYRQKFSLYKNGLIDIVEVNVAQNMLYQAERDYITAKYNYYLALFHQVVAQNNVDGFLQLFK